MAGLPHSPCMGTESAGKQETRWVSAQTRCVCTSMHAHEQQEGVRELSPSPTLSPLGWAGSTGDSWGDITAFTTWQMSCTWVSSCCIPHSASGSLLLQQRGEGQSGLQGSPFHRGTLSLFPLTLSRSHSHLHRAGTFCCPLHEGAAPLLGSQGCSPLLSCALPSSPARLLVPVAQRFPFLLGQHKAYTCFAPGLALITSHNWWDQIQEYSACILPDT